MKILIINPPFYRLQRASLVHYPPSCCYIAAVLEKAGFNDILIYNADFDPHKKTILGNTNHLNIKALTELAEEYDKRLHNDQDPVWKEIGKFIGEYRPDLLILSVFSTTLTAGNKIARMAKETNPVIKTIFEGSTNRGLHCAIDPSTNADVSVMDFALRKEPEETAIELVRALAAGTNDFSRIKGLSWKKNGVMIHNEDRPPLEDLDWLPFPARHRLYGAEKTPPHSFQGIYGSRGCPFDCVFCGCHTSWGHKPRLRSAKNMVDEMESVYRRFGTRYFYICDDIFFIQKDRALEFCDLLLQRRLPLFWSAQTRAEMADDKVLSMMRKAGGQHIAVGVEVGNPGIRKLIKKGNTVDDVRQCAKLIRKHGLYMVAFCMVGLPWEGPNEIQDTVNLIKEIKPYIVYPYLATPAAGTELADFLSKKNPQGLAEYRDRCHISTASSLTEGIDAEEKKRVLDKAMEEFARINRKSLLLDALKRLRFYMALAHDMGFFHNPGFFLGYLREYLE